MSGASLAGPAGAGEELGCSACPLVYCTAVYHSFDPLSSSKRHPLHSQHPEQEPEAPGLPEVAVGHLISPTPIPPGGHCLARPVVEWILVTVTHLPEL